jgi:hypothetical protein
VRLIPPAHVKPYVRRNKNDAVDAAAFARQRGGRASGLCRCVRREDDLLDFLVGRPVDIQLARQPSP